MNGEYDKKFKFDNPKKQAKSYEIDLGQNVYLYKYNLILAWTL